MGRGRRLGSINRLTQLRRSRTKFNKQKCMRCQYHCGCTLDSITSSYVICNYSSITGHTCLQRVSSNTIIDIRGDEYDNCKLFREGSKILVKSNPVVGSRSTTTQTVQEVVG